jgi:hypothetical protein
MKKISITPHEQISTVLIDSMWHSITIYALCEPIREYLRAVSYKDDTVYVLSSKNAISLCIRTRGFKCLVVVFEEDVS